MKRNLSSQAIRAMAIGMAVTLGSATAVSGVVTGTVVNVYAANDQVKNSKGTITKDGSDVLITLVASTGQFSDTKSDKTNGFTLSVGGQQIAGSGSVGSVELSQTSSSNDTFKIKFPISSITDKGINLDGSEKFTLSYNGSEDVKVNNVNLQLNNLVLEGNIDVVAPTIRQDNVPTYNKDDSTIVLTASEKLSTLGETENNSSNGQFTVVKTSQRGDNSVTVKNFIVGAGSDVSEQLKLTLSSPQAGISLKDGKYKVTYTKPGSSEKLKDKQGNVLATADPIASFVVAENQKNVEAKINKEKTKITLKPTSGTFENTSAQASEFKIGSSLKTPDSVSLEGKNIVLTFNQAVSGDTSKISYDPASDSNAVKLDGTVLFLNDLEVTEDNQVVDAPTIQSGVIEDNAKNQVILTFSQNIKVDVESNQPKATDFTVKVNNESNVVKKLSKISTDATSKTLTLTLTDEVKKGDVVKLNYKSSGNAIKNENGAELAEIIEDNAITIENKVTDGVKPPVNGDITATTSAGTYTFKNLGGDKVALVGFKATSLRAAQTNTFENGVLTAEGKTYTLVQIGDDNKTAITDLTDEALKGHTENVTNIKEEAFKGNVNIKNVSFPKVTNVGKNAFYGATALTSIDLGSASTGLTVAKDAFTGANKLKNIVTSEENKIKVEEAIKGSGLNDIKVITDENSNATDAKIAANKFYQTKDGLIFKGLSENELSFEGKDKFTAPTEPNGLTGETKEKAYLVTYADGIVSLKPGENTQPPVQESFDVTVKGKKLTFKPLTDNTVALASVGAPSVMRAAAANTLQDGVLDVSGKQYNFTQIGDGIASLATDFDANTVLAGNLDKVTTVAKDAFKDNTTLTEISLPKVTTIAEGAFSGTSNLAKVFLGDGVVTVGNDAFKGTKGDIKVSSNNEQTINNLKGHNTGLDAQDVENAAPFITSAVINNDAKDKIVLTFSEKVYAPQNITPGDFTVEGGSSYTVSSIEGLLTDKGQAKNTIKLTLDKQVKAGENLALKYTNSGKDIKDNSNEEVKLADISKGFNITNNIEAGVVLPKVTDAKVEDANKDKIVLTLDKAPTTPLEDTDKNDFTLTVVDGATKDHQIKNISTADTTVTITLDKALAADNRDIKLSYNGNKIETLNDQVVTNNIGKVQAVDVTVDSVTVNGTALTITVNNAKTLKNEPTLGKDGFTVTKGTANTSVDVSSAAVASNVITLTLGAAIEAGDTEIKVEYNGNNAKLVENSTNAPIAAIASQFAVNAKDATAPQLSTATATTTGNKQNFSITLPVSEPIKAKQDTIPTGKFVVTVVGGSKNATLNTVKITGNDKKSLLLEGTVDQALDESSDKLKVVYTASDEITDLKGNNLEDKTIDNINISAARTAAIVSSSDSDLVATLTAVEALNGKVTVVNSFKGTSQTEIQSMLTKDLTKIASGAFNGISGITLDLSNISVSVIDNGAFTGASNLKISYKGSEKDTYELAKKLGNIEGTTLNNEKPSDVIKDYENNSNNGSGGGGSSSGGSGGGSGANIGTITNKDPNTEETTSQGNNNNETVVENKQLSFDVIKLPSVEGEAKVFGDVSASHWAKSYIDKLSTAGIINGSNGMFNPNGQTKRADVTIMLVNLLGLTPEANNKFADVNASAYYAPYVGTASNYGIVNGSNGMFNPQGVISRQDTMVMIAQILKGLNLNVNADTTSLSQFGDASKVSAYANESVAILVNSGIIAGNNGKLNPTAPVTRAEMATIMSKLYDVLASANK